MKKNNAYTGGEKLFPWLNIGERRRKIAAVALSVFLPLFLIYGIVMTGHIGRQSFEEACLSMGDARARYLESSFVLEGVDPYDVLFRKVPAPEGYRDLKGGGISPWSMILNIPFVWPLMGEDVAYYSFMLTFCVCLAVIVAVIYRWGAAETKSKWFAACLALAFIAQYGMWATFRVGNQALIPLAAFSILLYSGFVERHRVLGGIVLAFAMIKPQSSLLYFVAMLWRKKFIQICVAVAVVVGAWVAASALVGKSPLEFYWESSQFLLREIKSANIYAGPLYSTCSSFLGESLSFNLGIVLGVLFTFLLAYKYRGLPKEYLYCIPTAIMPIYTYSFAQTTTMFHGFIMLAIIMFLAKNRVGKFSLCVYAAAIAVVMIYVPRTAVSAVFPDYVESLTQAGLLRHAELFPYCEDIYRTFMLLPMLVLLRDASKAREGSGPSAPEQGT